MYSKLFKDLSVNTLQVLANQFLGVFIFLLLSRYLDKELYGELNWSLAVLTCCTTILSLRLEQIVVRNVAAGKDPSRMLTLFIAHNGIMGAVFFILLLAGNTLFPVFFSHHPILWLLCFSQLLTFFSLPFRQLATGRSAFGWLAILSTTSNLIRCCWLGWLIAFSNLAIRQVVVVFTVSALAEFLLGAYIVLYRLSIPLSKWRFPDYTALIRESLPQVGLVFLNAGLARMDWILLGLFSSPGRTAEYSFAYRAYEFSPLPLLIGAPFLLNWFSKNGRIGTRQLDLLVRLEMIFATLLPLLLIIAWSPLVDRFTDNKYGHSSAFTFLILSCCIPFQYIINLYWTDEFAGQRLKRIFRITAITGAVMLAGDLLLIPAYAGPGAALAYLVAMIVQYALYYRASSLEGRDRWLKHLLLAIGIALCSGFPAEWLATGSLLVRLGVAFGLYALLTGITNRLSVKDLALWKEWRKRAVGDSLFVIDEKWVGP
jgi:O-antigen/teichoic acid export membrane protein